MYMQVIDIVWHKYLRWPYTLAVKDKGRGKTVVLIHGLAASGRVWRPLIRLLDLTKWRVIVPDLLGFGDSPKPGWNDYSVQEHARMIVATLTRRGVKKPITVVGHSMGCLIAVHIAATNPKLVKKLVLYEPPLFVDAPEFRAHTRRRERYFAFFTYIAAHPQLALTHSHLLWRIAKRISGLHMSEEEWIPFERSLRNTIMQQTAYNELRTIAVPTEIVHGRLDIIVIRTEVKKMFKDNPHIMLHMVTDMHNISSRSARFLLSILDVRGK